jgi:hypothetical protein
MSTQPVPDMVAALEVLGAELQARGLTYETREDGELYALFANDDALRFAIAGRVLPAPQHGLVLSAAAVGPVPRDAWPITFVACNNWNAMAASVKAHLFIEDWKTSEAGRLMLQSWLPIAPNEPPAAGQVHALVDVVLTACVAFWLPDVVARAAADKPAN